MAFRVVRLRREARRNAKLDDIFQDRDPTQSGKITWDQMVDIFRIYQVELDRKVEAKITDENGEISREDFIKFAHDNKLLDFGNLTAGDVSKQKLSKTNQGPRRSMDKASSRPGAHNLLCCCSSLEDDSFSPAVEDGMDKVELAFRKFDLDKDGYLSWEEFRQLGMEEDQALRIFQSCPMEVPGKMSLEEFRRTANRKPQESSHSLHQD